MNRAIDPELGEIETLLRRRLNELADHAPVTVRQPHELTVSPPTDAVPNRRRRAAGIGATIAVIAGGIGISTVAFQGASNPGGADSPEEAVREFAEAAEREDVLGMIDVALPEEVTALRAVFEEATNEVERVGVLDESFSLAAVAGIDITLPGLTLTTENVAADLAVVTATGGTANATFDPTVFPLGSVVREVLGDELAASELSQPLGSTDPNVMLVTVARDGRWYVSLGFTVAEYARVAAGAPFPPPTTIEPVGLDSPEAAAMTFYEHLAALDLEGAMATMAPGEGDALLRYSPLFLPSATAAIERGHADGLTVSISDVEFETSGSGDHRTLTPVSFVVAGTVPWTWGSGMVADPTLPTIVYAMDGRYGVVPPGEQVPATIDELELVSDFPGPSLTNQTYEMPDGTIAPLDFPSDGSEGPQPFRVERRDGCTDLTGPGIDALLPGIGSWDSAAGTTASEIEGGHRFCDGSELFSGSIGLLFGAGLPTELPSIGVVEADGRWYVSPIGTAGAAVVGMFRSVPDDANLIDTPMALWLLQGMNRRMIDSRFAAGGTVPQECAPIVTVGADGIATVIPDPPVSEIRACVNSLFTGDSNVGSGSFMPAPTVEAEEAVPESVPAASVPQASVPQASVPAADSGG